MEGKDFDKEYLLPYPGVYFDDELDLESQAIEAMKLLYPDYSDRNVLEKFIKEVVRISKIKAEEFFQYREKWESMMEFIDQSQSIDEVIIANCRI